MTDLECSPYLNRPEITEREDRLLRAARKLFKASDALVLAESRYRSIPVRNITQADVDQYGAALENETIAHAELGQALAAYKDRT